MSVVFVLLPLALLFVAIALAWFVWAVRSGQFDDLETPAVRMLFDDEPAKPGSPGNPGSPGQLCSPAQAGPAGNEAGAAKASEREVEIR